MSALSARLRKAREMSVEAGGHTFTVLRPTPLEREEGVRTLGPSRWVLSLVIGWGKVTESDLLPGGDPHPLPFDQDACSEWLSDRPDLFAVVADGVVKGFTAYAERLDASLKN